MTKRHHLAFWLLLIGVTLISLADFWALRHQERIIRDLQEYINAGCHGRYQGEE